MQSDKYRIDNSVQIGRLLPFYARGWRISRLLVAIAHPIETLHQAWLSWAEERIIEASITSQPMSLAWYLTHKLKAHFINHNDSFVITNGLSGPENIVYTEGEYFEADENSKYVYCQSESAPLTMIIRRPQEVMEPNTNYTIYPPDIEETNVYNNTDYRVEIMRLTKRYATSFRKIIINV